MDELKKKIVYQLLESIEDKEDKKFQFIVWFQKMSWYTNAGIPFSNLQLNEIIEFLTKLKEES
jgi:hypothetical protein